MLSSLAPTRSAGQQNVVEDPEKEHNPTSFMRQLLPGPDISPLASGAGSPREQKGNASL